MKSCVALALVALACAAPPPPEPEHVAPAPAPMLAPIRVCTEVSATARSDVGAGVSGWRFSTQSWRGWVDIGTDITDWRCDLMLVEVDPGDFCEYGQAACVVGLGGLDRPKPVPGVVHLVRGVYEPFARLVVLHEIGHLLGLSHLAGTMMDPFVSAIIEGTIGNCPDEPTIARLEMRLGVFDLQSCTL